jgi:hypothetical protein
VLSLANTRIADRCGGVVSTLSSCAKLCLSRVVVGPGGGGSCWVAACGSQLVPPIRDSAVKAGGEAARSGGTST